MNDKKDRIRQQYSKDRKSDVLVIPQSQAFSTDDFEHQHQRVSAYCRVSTPDEAQTSSYELQCKYYKEYIDKQATWSLVDIYADEGISGTNRKKRDEFNRMIRDCRAGKIDLIITKSVSRFSRNVVDCLSVVRELNALVPPVGVLFQTENIDTRVKGNETFLTILSAFSQEESRAKSESMLWSVGKRYTQGNFLCPTNALLGYRKATEEEAAQFDDPEEAKMVIEPEGAKTVRLIYAMFLAGYSCNAIAHTLTSLGRPTGKGNLVWSSSSVRNILKNERYCGDIVGQKTFTKDFLDHETEQNRGQRPVYYNAGHHQGIVSQQEHIQALLLLASHTNAQGVNALYTITVIREGLLTGFIPINRAFGGYHAAHYIQASINAASEDSKKKRVQIIDFPGCEVARIQEFGYSRQAAVIVSAKSISFNSDCICKLPHTEYVEFLLHPIEKLFAIRPCGKDCMNAVKWMRIKDDKIQSPTISCVAFCKTLYELMGWRMAWRLKLRAVCLNKNDESVLLFDLRDTEYRLFIEDVQLDNEQSDALHRRKTQTLHPVEWRDSFGLSVPEHAMSCRWHRAALFNDWQIDAQGVSVKGFESLGQIASAEEIQEQIDALILKEPTMYSPQSAEISAQQ